MRTGLLLPLSPEHWTEGPVVVVVAHPDDEVLGCGVLMARLGDVTVIHVTDGAPRGGDSARHGFANPSDYAAVRRIEATAALALAGVASDRLQGLGIADQAAPAALVEITRALMPLIAGAAAVLTHAYEGGHGDHDAVAFGVHMACRLIGADHRPALLEMPFYHAGPTGWVRQRFLPVPRYATVLQASEVVILSLSPAERALKARMITTHATQAATLCDFALDVECFRVAPAYDFACRPHDGPLLYERHGWSLTWPLWTAWVEAALAALNVPAA